MSLKGIGLNLRPHSSPPQLLTQQFQRYYLNAQLCFTLVILITVRLIAHKNIYRERDE